MKVPQKHRIAIRLDVQIEFDGHMKIIEVYANFLPILGGVQTHIYDLCKCLLEKGGRPIVLTWGPPTPSFEVIDGIPVHRFWMPLPFYAARYPALFYLSLKIIHLVRKLNIDVIHAHNYFCGLASAMAGKLLRKPVVVTFHAPMWFWPNLELPAYVSLMEPILKKYFISSVASIVCNSKFTYREMLKRGFPSSKLKIIYNWVTPFPRCDTADLKKFLERFNLAKRHYILSVGRLVDREKGFSVLIHALKLLINREYDLDLVLVGDGPDKEMLQKYSSSLAIENHVHFLGSITGKDLSCLYQGCEVFALPSRYESFGLAQLEAISVGKPVVSTKVGGIPEIIENGYNGILVNSRPTAFASAIEKLLLTPQLEKTFAKRSLEIVSERFSIKNCHNTIDLLGRL